MASFRSSAGVSGKSSVAAMVVFFGIFFVAGCAAFYFVFLGPLLRVMEARGWAQTPCIVMSSSVESHAGKSTTYSVNVKFRYNFGGREHVSEQYSLADGSSSGYASKAAIVARLKPRKPAVCYVNPRNPEQAVIERGVTGEMLMGLLSLIFVAVGAGGIFFTLRMKRRETTSRFAAGAVGGSQVTDEWFLPKRVATSGPVTLKPLGSPLGMLIGVTLAAVFWNGIVSVFVVSMINDYSRSRRWDDTAFSVFGMLFMVPFVLAGLGLIGAFFYQLLAMKNPKLTLTVNRDALGPGDPLDVAWEMDGRVERVRKLRIELVGSEEATYTRGTKTSTDRHEFAVLPLIETTDVSEMASGAASLTIPPGAMHSFDAQHNKIIWKLRVKGEIPRWPNVKAEFRVVVLPVTQGAIG